MLFEKYFFTKSFFTVNVKSLKVFLNEEITTSSFFILLLLFIFYQFFILCSNIYFFNLYKSSLSKLKISDEVVFIKNYLLNSVVITYTILCVSVKSVKSYSTSLWFSHLLVDSFQLKMLYFLIFMSFLVLLITVLSFVSVSSDKLDFLISIINLVFWLKLMFFANNLFTFIFIIEVLSVSIVLLNATSIFYSNNFTTKANFSNNMIYYLNLPYIKLNSILFYFWVSFFSSINLFLFLYFYIYYFLTLDSNLSEFVIFSIKKYWTLFNFIPWAFSWFMLITSIFIKCGLVPFFLWKPQFFKGLSMLYIFIYTTLYYFLLLLFLMVFLFSHYNELFSTFIIISISLTLIGLVFLMGLVYNVTYLKPFLAYSSIINTVFIFLIILNFNLNNLNSVI